MTAEKTPDELLLELMLSPERRNPHDLYRDLRERAPVHRSDLAPVPAPGHTGSHRQSLTDRHQPS